MARLETGHVVGPLTPLPSAPSEDGKMGVHDSPRASLWIRITGVAMEMRRFPGSAHIYLLTVYLRKREKEREREYMHTLGRERGTKRISPNQALC